MQVAQPETTIGQTFDVERFRRDFPALNQRVHDRPLVYLDNAATSQKPRQVIARTTRYYLEENANVHRGVHYLSQTATDVYEGSREKIASFIGAPSTAEVIFTKGTTDAINLVATSYGRKHVGAGDEIVITGLDHHSNIVPWQLLCEEKGALLRVVPVLDDGSIDYEAYRSLLNERTRIVAFAHVSNALGTVLPAEQMISDAHAAGAVALLDGAQAVPHRRVDVEALDCDFYCFSGHKMFGPTGTGILYGKRHLLEEMPPYQGGGDMIEQVTFERSTWNELPHKFEAGTPHIAGFVGLGAAVDYLEEVGLEQIEAYEHELVSYAMERLEEAGGVSLIGTAPGKAAVVSFLVDGVHPYDAGAVLDRLGIAVRTGHHCTQPLMARFGIPGTVRASFAFYNTRQEVDALVEGVAQVKKMFA